MHLSDVGSESLFRSQTPSAQLFGLDGVPQGSAVLANGDEVQIGKFRLVFLTGPTRSWA
jgi:hypothetical protein